MTDQTIKYGWYSLKAAQLGGTTTYVNQEGKLVQVTCVTQDKEGIGYQWDDKQYVGLVVKWVSGRLEKI